jgi:CRP-like cAMP-binding protein
LNQLLRLLSPTDSKLLAPYLKLAKFEQHHVLFEADEQIRHVYFPANAVVSLVITLSTGETVEAAMVGGDGVVGASAALDGKISLSRGIIQLGGEIIVCDIDALKSTALQSPNIRHEQTVYAQAQQSAACFATHQVEARLCRWLLRARDLSGSDNLPFTQEYLAEMLGVRRTSVTAVAKTLQEAGLIRYARGKIQIVDAKAMQKSTCECYGSVKLLYEKLIGPVKK